MWSIMKPSRTDLKQDVMCCLSKYIALMWIVDAAVVSKSDAQDLKSMILPSFLMCWNHSLKERNRLSGWQLVNNQPSPRYVTSRAHLIESSSDIVEANTRPDEHHPSTCSRQLCSQFPVEHWFAKIYKYLVCIDTFISVYMIFTDNSTIDNNWTNLIQT